MQDLTQGSVMRHLVRMTLFLMGSMFFQSLYFLADMYWVGRLGKESVAAVGLAANLMLIVLALTQSLGVGTTAMISHATGEKQRSQANLIFNQSFLLSPIGGGIFFVVAFFLRTPYCGWLAADATTARLAEEYLFWFIPALALQFPLISMGAALRGTGIVKPTVAVLILSVSLNLVLAPLLVFGWVFKLKLGVAGAAIATLVAVSVGSLLLFGYFFVREKYLEFLRADWRPLPDLWRKILAIGLPTGAELGILAIYLLLVYSLIRSFGAAAQGGFAIGARVIQSLNLPAVAVGMANAPIVGQSLGARDWPRVRRAFFAACILATSMMLVVTLLCQSRPEAIIRVFSKQADVIQVGADYLRAISLIFCATGLIFAASSVFQGIGNTRPPFVSSVLRLFIFAVPVLILARGKSLDLSQVWYISAMSIAFQAAANLVFLRREMRACGRRIATQMQVST